MALWREWKEPQGGSNQEKPRCPSPCRCGRAERAASRVRRPARRAGRGAVDRRPPTRGKPCPRGCQWGLLPRPVLRLHTFLQAPNFRAIRAAGGRTARGTRARRRHAPPRRASPAPPRGGLSLPGWPLEADREVAEGLLKTERAWRSPGCTSPSSDVRGARQHCGRWGARPASGSCGGSVDPKQALCRGRGGHTCWERRCVGVGWSRTGRPVWSEAAAPPRERLRRVRRRRGEEGPLGARWRGTHCRERARAAWGARLCVRSY